MALVAAAAAGTAAAVAAGTAAVVACLIVCIWVEEEQPGWRRLDLCWRLQLLL